MMKFKQQGLVADLMPNIRVMQISGHFLFNYYNDNSIKFVHQVYCSVSKRMMIVVVVVSDVSMLSTLGPSSTHLDPIRIDGIEFDVRSRRRRHSNGKHHNVIVLLAQRDKSHLLWNT